MKLVGTLTSPYVRKVRIVLAEKRIDHEFLNDPPASEGSSVPHFNPLGKVPVLILDDGEGLYDSRVIVEYLDLHTPVCRLLPEDGRERVEVRKWEALADGICDAAVLVVMEKRRPEGMQSAEFVSKQMMKVERGLRALAAGLGEKSWCMGEVYTLADIAVACLLGYLSLRFPEISWREDYPNLARLESRMMKHTAYADTIPRD
ncbi:MAG: glutathione S-transferase [Burkholderiales bacterium]|nr:glutathione S-transferase [Burkholderiales bacterium]